VHLFGRRFLLQIVAVIGLAGAAFLLYGRFGPAVTTPAAAVAPPAVPVGVATAVRQDVPLILTGLGNVQPYQQTLVRPQVDGQLIEVGFHEGSEVKAGDVLAKIDPRTYQAAVDQAIAKKAQDEAQLANVRADEKRYQELADRNFISRQQLDTTRAQAAQLEAAVKGDAASIASARVLLDFTTIRAPINGRAGIRQIDVGNIVHPGDANGIVVITQLRPIAVVFSLPEDQVPLVLNAQRNGTLAVTVLSRDSQQVLDRGRLELVDNQIDQTTAMVKLKSIFDNKNGMLWPGQFVNAQLEVGAVKGAVTVPAAALQHGQQGQFVWAVKSDGAVEARTVTLGQINNGAAIVESGILADEKIVISGQYRLKPGVRIVETATGDDGAK